MSLILRIVLLLGALMCAVWIMKRIRAAEIKMEDSIFWVLFSVMLAILGIFPNLAVYLADKLQIQSPANFVFLLIIALLIEKTLSLSLIQSQLQESNTLVIAEMALRSKNLEDEIEFLKERLKEVEKYHAREQEEIHGN